MKTILRLLFTFSLLACITFTTGAFSYYISFTGSGASTTVDSVVVQNLFKGTQVTVPENYQLQLYDVEASIDKLNTITDFACVYPNPMTDNTTFSFVVKNDGNTQIAVYRLDGRKVAALDVELPQGKNSFQLTLPKGVYLVQAKGNGFSYASKAISLNMTDCQPLISFDGNLTESKPQKVAVSEVKLQYTQGDQILYKGYSGNYCTRVTDKPSDTKTIDFNFVDCIDADGNHYAVVQIGEQIWMAENLKTTRYRNGDAIGTTSASIIPNDATSKYQWAYEGDEAIVNKYGRLYTWYAATDTRNLAPVGWHLPSDAERYTLEIYMIANEYNYDGTTTGNKAAKALAATTDWSTYSGIGTIGNDLTKNNSSGFTALPGGYRLSSGTIYNVGYSGFWWFSTQSNATWAMCLAMNHYQDYWFRTSREKNCGLNVRCVKD